MAEESGMTQTETQARMAQEILPEAADLRLPAILPPVAYPLETLVPQTRQQTPAVGQRVTRPDARLHGLGQTKYIADLALPGMVYARVKRAGIASARIKSVDTSAAEALPGVMAVLIGREIPVNSFGPSLQDQPVLADERVFHAGDGVAAVAAVTEQIAAEALDRIKVEYEPLPAVFDPLQALKDDSPRGASPGEQYLRDQSHQERRCREGLRRLRPYLRGAFPDPDG